MGSEMCIRDRPTAITTRNKEYENADSSMSVASYGCWTRDAAWEAAYTRPRPHAQDAHIPARWSSGRREVFAVKSLEPYLTLVTIAIFSLSCRQQPVRTQWLCAPIHLKVGVSLD